MNKTTIDPASAYLMQIDPIATGRQLRRMRLWFNLTQEALSRRFEEAYDSASKNAISMWETGKKLPSLSHMVFLSELYGCRIDELVVSRRRSRDAGDRDQPVPCLRYAVTNVRICIHSSFLLTIGWNGSHFQFDYKSAIFP